jgi:hypothetical protein
MTEPLKTITVIVDRIVLAELLEWAGGNAYCLGDPVLEERLDQIQQQVESGERCELYARDWPISE